MSSRNAKQVDWPRTLLRACRLIEDARAPVALARLAGAVGVSGSELQRQFTRRLGVSPKAYGQALQLHRLARGAGRTASALDAVYDAGFGSAATGYARSTRELGAPPAQLRGVLAIDWWLGLSDLGWMLMAATRKGICWLAFGEEPGALLEDLRAAFPKATLRNDEARLRDWFERVREFVLLPRAALGLPTDVQGTAFQASVWRSLRRIPLGQTRSYKDVAEALGRPTASRAVAAACASNKVALLIPCHRVVGAEGRLAGYRWGLRRKAALLEREGRGG
jgi:AraC family transcriptional regulator of adaptative response/methylated-DNA-[protein]-cysteine methyltransferase